MYRELEFLVCRPRAQVWLCLVSGCVVSERYVYFPLSTEGDRLLGNINPLASRLPARKQPTTCATCSLLLLALFLTASPPAPPPPEPIYRTRNNTSRQVIILSAVRSNHGGRVGFLADWRRLNVAITRARRGVVVVGDPDTLKRDRHWRAFLQWCERRGAAMGETSLYLAGGGGEREEAVGSAVSPWVEKAVEGVGEAEAPSAGVVDRPDNASVGRGDAP